MSGWKPISEWREYKEKNTPRLVIFRYAPTTPNRPGGSYLSESYRIEYPFGQRTATHFQHIKGVDE